jgi:sulfatase maturation enzyme AslB (radical SAM superfamily)
MCADGLRGEIIGDVNRGIDWDAADAFVQSSVREECLCCRFLPICAGECALRWTPGNGCPDGLGKYIAVSLEHDLKYMARKSDWRKRSRNLRGRYNALWPTFRESES